MNGHIAWIHARTSLALLSPALICLRGSRTVKRVSWDFRNVDIDVETNDGAMSNLGLVKIFFFFVKYFKLNEKIN